MAAVTIPLSGIYAIRSKQCGKIYVGSSIHIAKRFRQHTNELRRGVHCSAKLQAAWSKFGEYNFSFEILELVPGPECLTEREQAWMDALDVVDNGLNTLFVADPRAEWSPDRRANLSAKRMGHPVSEATREKLRQANLGKKQSAASNEKKRLANVGKKMSPEAVAKTAAFWTGREHTTETRAKQSAARVRMYAAGTPHPWVGRKHTPETIAKMVGRAIPAETRAKISAARKNQRASAEQRAAQSARQLGKKKTPMSASARENCRIAANKRHAAMMLRAW